MLMVAIAYQINDISIRFSRMFDLMWDELEKTNAQISRLEVWLEHI